MSSTIMSTTLEETVSYRHKKFDQTKRMRTDSLNSLSSDYDCIKVETEELNEGSELSDIYRPVLNTKHKRSRTQSSTYATDSSEQQMPAAKRKRYLSGSEASCTSSFSSLTQIHLSSTTPLPTTTIPPPAAILPKISDETLRSVCKYHGNMVRKFPKKERTPKDQERRNKNTIACRMSRRVKKLEHIAIEEQYKEFTKKTYEIIEQSMRATAYLHELMKLSSCPPDTKKISNEGVTDLKIASAEKPITTTQQKNSFTIDSLLNGQ